jgi:hypothetical protein
MNADGVAPGILNKQARAISTELNAMYPSVVVLCLAVIVALNCINSPLGSTRSAHVASELESPR